MHLFPILINNFFFILIEIRTKMQKKQAVQLKQYKKKVNKQCFTFFHLHLFIRSIQVRHTEIE